MPSEETSAGKTELRSWEAAPTTAGRRGEVFGLWPWFALVAALVIGGLLLSARAGDAYTALVGLLFAAFGAFLGFRLLGRMLP